MLLLEVQGKDKKIPRIIEFSEKPLGDMQFYKLDIEDKPTYGLPKINHPMVGVHIQGLSLRV